MENRLLDRQVSLLAYLTSGDAIFGEGRKAPLDQALQGIDPALLRLEARFSFEKRLEKIASVFPRSLEILGGRAEGTLRDFVQACPPEEMSRLANARQFHVFVSGRAGEHPPYLTDVMACELACALAAHAGEGTTVATQGRHPTRRAIRRRPGVFLVRCNYDIQSIFEHGAGTAPPPNGETLLGVTIPPGASQPRIFGVPPPVFDLLAALDDWADPGELEGATEAEELIRELADHGLIEARP